MKLCSAKFSDYTELKGRYLTSEYCEQSAACCSGVMETSSKIRNYTVVIASQPSPTEKSGAISAYH